MMPYSCLRPPSSSAAFRTTTCTTRRRRSCLRRRLVGGCFAVATAAPLVLLPFSTIVSCYCSCYLGVNFYVSGLTPPKSTTTTTRFAATATRCLHSSRPSDSSSTIQWRRQMTTTDENNDYDDDNEGVPPPPFPFRGGSSRSKSGGLYSNEELQGLLDLHDSLSKSTFSTSATSSSSSTSKTLPDPTSQEDDEPSFQSLHELVMAQTSSSSLPENEKEENNGSSIVNGDAPTPQNKSTNRKYQQFLQNEPSLRAELGNIRMVAADVDGTLLSSQHDLHPITSAAVKRAIEDVQSPTSQLQHFVLATGKSRAGALGSLGPEMTSLLSQVPGVFIQGLYIVDGSGEVLFEKKLGRDEVNELEQLANAYGFSLIAYDGDTIYATSSSLPRHIVEVHDKYGEPKPIVIETLRDHEPGFHKILVMEDDTEYLQDKFRPKMEALANKYNCVVTKAIPNMLELLPPACSKAVGVQKLCEALGVNPHSQLLAIGDGENDFEMLEMAAVGVAVGNAVPLAIEAADIVLEETNNDGGAGVAIELFGLGDILA